MIGPALRAGTSVGCLPEHAGHPATRQALALLAVAGVELVTLTAEAGDDSMSGALVWPGYDAEARGCLVSWFIAGHMDEPELDPEQREQVRAARNTALQQIEEILRAAGWDAYATYARRTLPPRAERVAARPLTEEEQQQRAEALGALAAFALRIRAGEDDGPAPE
ncbi:hypothetical protein ACFWA9_29225 [Kitasatospora sp. NPDC059973]|uniref:hypothetical protein n=1 Tax=Kitasatospora sp. NPDC059973 TaxID=3347020 RepID=UPI0036BC390F